jgi:UDPglucose 6-dehydrogenase
MNEIANLAEALGADVEDVRRGIGSDPRIGHQFLYAGAGYGGSCFPKDVKALQRTAAEARRELRVVAAVEAVNETQKHVLAVKIQRRFGERLNGKCLAVWGLAFKANTDDMREAASLTLISDLVSAGAAVRAYDPAAGAEAKRILKDNRSVEVVESASAALAGADALAVITEWQEFRSPDFRAIRAALKTPAIFDGRNLYDPRVVQAAGLEYHPIGRRT